MASGQSLTDEDVEYVKKARDDGRISGVVAISDVGLDKAPWADFLVSSDSAWWQAHPQSKNFEGRKLSRHQLRQTKQFIVPINACNSGLMGMYAARDEGKADKIILLGFDMHGTHYFGPHHHGLKNTSERRFSEHRAQFKRFVGASVINCTPGSSLTLFPMAALRDII